MYTRTPTLLATLSLIAGFGLACTGVPLDDTGADTGAGDTGAASPDDSGDGGGTDGGSDDGGGDGGGSDGGANDGGSGDGGSGDGGSDDGGSDGGSEPASPVTFLEDPCQGKGTPYALTFTSATQGYVGCGNGMGLHQTSDRGDTFSQAHPSNDLYVYQVLPQRDGGLLVCGHDYEEYDDALLFRYDGSDWTVLLSYGNNSSNPASAYLSNCGAVADAGDGRLVVASNTAGDISTSEDDGLTWTAAERYWEDENLRGGYSYHYIMEMVTLSDGWAASGSQITEPPVFFGPSAESEGAWWNRAASTIDGHTDGEAWALATPDDGVTWLAGGRDQDDSSSASGFIFRSTDGGQTWTGGDLGDDLDIVQDISFDADGLRGAAVGHRYPTSHGGFLLTTTDGGQTWVDTEVEVDLLHRVAVVDGTIWFAGDGVLARTSFTELELE